MRGGLNTASLTLALAALVGGPASAQADARLAMGRQLFNGGVQPSCALCHTLKEAGAEGQVGPSLDELRPDAGRVATALRNGLGSMPSFRALLSDAQIEALSWYVARASGGAK
jgi:sulfite dehydrogenase